MVDLVRQSRTVRLDEDEAHAVLRLAAEITAAGKTPGLSETLRAAALVLARWIYGEGPLLVHVYREAKWHAKLEELIEARVSAGRPLSPTPGRSDDPRQQPLFPSDAATNLAGQPPSRPAERPTAPANSPLLHYPQISRAWEFRPVCPHPAPRQARTARGGIAATAGAPKGRAA